MAEGLVKDFPAIVKPVLQFCLNNDINVMQMPCPETQCSSGGLGRIPRGKKWYEEQGLRSTSRDIAVGQVQYMAKLRTAGITILAVIGIDFSPACAVNYLNKGRSVQKGTGIYFEELQKAMAAQQFSIPFIGIRQAWQKKMLAQLEALIA
jgi:predicted secreted protein